MQVHKKKIKVDELKTLMIGEVLIEGEEDGQSFNVFKKEGRFDIVYKGKCPDLKTAIKFGKAIEDDYATLKKYLVEFGNYLLSGHRNGMIDRKEIRDRVNHVDFDNWLNSDWKPPKNSILGSSS